MPNVFAVPGTLFQALLAVCRVKFPHSAFGFAFLLLPRLSLLRTEHCTDNWTSFLHLLPRMLGVQYHRLSAAGFPQANPRP
jgi:hypothetical protein